MSSNKNPNEPVNDNTIEDGAPNRRNVLLGGTTLAAATLVAATAQRVAKAQPAPPLLSVLILAAAMDVPYQIIALHALRPLETLFIAVVLAFLPYLILRGPVQRIARRILRKSARPSYRTGCAWMRRGIARIGL